MVLLGEGLIVLLAIAASIAAVAVVVYLLYLIVLDARAQRRLSRAPLPSGGRRRLYIVR